MGVPVGYEATAAQAVNADGRVVVGTAVAFDDLGSVESFRATIWTQELGNRDLQEYLALVGVNLSGWDLGWAHGVSADGSVIVGNGWYNGVYQGWVVTIPSPAAALLLGGGMIVASGCRRRSPASGFASGREKVPAEGLP